MKVKKKLLDLVRDKIRFKHYSYSTEKTYVHWIKQYIFFHNTILQPTFLSLALALYLHQTIGLKQ